MCGVGQAVDEEIGGLIRVALRFTGKNLALVGCETGACARE